MADDMSWMDALPNAAPAGAPPAAASYSATVTAPAPAPQSDIPMMTIRPSGPPSKQDNSWMAALPDATSASQPALSPRAQSWKDWAFGPPNPNDFSQQVVGGVAAALHGIPRGIVGEKVADTVDAATEAPIRMIYGNLPPTPQQPEGFVGQEQVQGPFGPQPPQGFRFATPAQAMDEGLQEAQRQTRFARSFAPVSETGGELMGAAAGGLMAAPALARAPIAAGAPLLARAGNIGSSVLKNAAFGGLMSSAAGGDPTTGAAIGGAVPLVGTALNTAAQPIIKPIAGAFQRAAQVVSPAAREASVGSTLNRVMGSSPTETSLVGPLDLAQASNNANVAAKVDVAPQINAAANSSLRDAQQEAINRQVGRIGAPATRADAGEALTQSIRNANRMADKQESALWNVPELKSQPVQSHWLKNSMNDAVNALDPGLQLGVTGSVKQALNMLENMPEKATVGSLNSVRSALLAIARNPPNDNPWARSVASKLASSFLDAMDRTLSSSAVSPDIVNSWRAARDFSREYHGSAFSYPDLGQIIAERNGVSRLDASEASRRLFNFSYGSPEGPEAIDNLASFVSRLKDDNAGYLSGTMRAAARSYMATAIRDAGRLSDGQNFNVKTLQDMLRTNGPWMKSSGLLEPAQIEALDQLTDYVEMLRRPEQLMRQVNSATSGREFQKQTFIDQIMSGWQRHIASFTIGGPVGTVVGHIAGPEIGTAAAGSVMYGVEGAVKKAEDSMRELMAQALLNSQLARALRMKATAGNMGLLSQETRDTLNAARTAITSDVVPHFVGRAQSEAPVQMSQ